MLFYELLTVYLDRGLILSKITSCCQDGWRQKDSEDDSNKYETSVSNHLLIFFNLLNNFTLSVYHLLLA